MSKKSQKEFKKEVENLEKLLDDVTMDFGDTEKQTVLAQEIDMNAVSSAGLDYDKIQEEYNKKAEEIVRSFVHYHIPTGMQHFDYINQKMGIDVITISNLLFQMITSDHAIKHMLREIDAGNYNPRMFEMLSKLQDSKMGIIKHLKQIEIVMENSYRGIAEELMLEGDKLMDREQQKALPGIGSKKGGCIGIGSKAILQELNKADKAEETEYKEI